MNAMKRDRFLSDLTAIKAALASSFKKKLLQIGKFHTDPNWH
jgi:hypothetical protein